MNLNLPRKQIPIAIEIRNRDFGKFLSVTLWEVFAFVEQFEVRFFIPPTLHRENKIVELCRKKENSLDLFMSFWVRSLTPVSYSAFPTIFCGQIMEGKKEASAKPVQEGYYIRTRGELRGKLEETLVDLYSTPGIKPKSWIFSSGMNAISSLLQCLVMELITKKPNEKIIFLAGDELYVDTIRVLDFLKKTFYQFSYILVRISDTKEILTLFANHKNEIKAFFMESCSNPSGHMFDFGQVKEIRKLAPECKIIVDNTWLSSVLFNPFAFNVDFAVISLTKYYSGGRCIAGAVLGSSKNMNLVVNYALMTGIHLSPVQVNLLLEGISDKMSDRVMNAGKNALEVCRYLESKPKKLVHRVMYPLLESHPSFLVNSKLLQKGGPGCFWFHIPISKAMVKEWVLHAKTGIVYETSFGDSYTKLDPWPLESPSNIYDGKGSDASNGTWIRISCGHNQAAKEIIQDMELLLNSIPLGKGMDKILS